ncbi:MAG: pyroglutamyl-peptidase [Verrucomicrobiales bacterium]|jgi:pyroglutamyl-peptidase
MAVLQPSLRTPIPVVLLTGFEPFDGMSENLSASLIRHLRSSSLADNPTIDLRFAILPVSYQKADERLLALLNEHRPDIVLAFGIGRREELITIERIAVNVDDAQNCDNCGESRNGARIEADGPAAYFCNLPTEQIRQSLLDARIPATVSNHAGAFLCNHILYRLLHASETDHCPSAAGFFHLPRIEWNGQVQAHLECAVTIITSVAAGLSLSDDA